MKSRLLLRSNLFTSRNIFRIEMMNSAAAMWFVFFDFRVRNILVKITSLILWKEENMCLWYFFMRSILIHLLEYCQIIYTNKLYK